MGSGTRSEIKYYTEYNVICNEHQHSLRRSILMVTRENVWLEYRVSLDVGAVGRVQETARRSA